jgi:hypothetical protein
VIIKDKTLGSILEDVLPYISVRYVSVKGLNTVEPVKAGHAVDEDNDSNCSMGHPSKGPTVSMATRSNGRDEMTVKE